MPPTASKFKRPAAAPRTQKTIKKTVPQAGSSSSVRPLTVGSVCTGWAAEAQALRNLQEPCTHLFGCDKAKASRLFCESNFDIGMWFDDIYSREFRTTAPTCDIFSAGFPCQPYSMEGRHQGSNDERADVLGEILAYVKKNRPKVVMLENVAAFMKNDSFSDVRDMLFRVLKNAGYKVHHKILNSKNYGVCQSRSRVYFACVRNDVPGSFEWPDEVKMPPISTSLDSGVELKVCKSAGERIRACIKEICNDPEGPDITRTH
eukprot:2119311-Pyramimonas_sp.AAC.1